DDVFRGYFSIIAGVKAFLGLGKTSRVVGSTLLELMKEALEIIENPEENWVEPLMLKLTGELHRIRDRTFRVDGRMGSVRYIPARKREGGYCDRFVLRLHQAQPHVIPVGGSTRKAYACIRSRGADGIRQATWTRAQLGVEIGKDELPVFIEKHAIARLEE